MSTVTLKSAREHRVTAPSLSRRKRRGETIAMLTAYDFAFARIFDTAGIDVLLVGDSLGNVVQGRDTTLQFPSAPPTTIPPGRSRAAKCGDALRRRANGRCTNSRSQTSFLSCQLERAVWNAPFGTPKSTLDKRTPIRIS